MKRKKGNNVFISLYFIKHKNKFNLHYKKKGFLFLITVSESQTFFLVFWAGIKGCGRPCGIAERKLNMQ